MTPVPAGTDQLEHRVVWQRAGQAKKRALYQTLEGATRCAARQETARDDMDWLSEPLPEIVFGPIVESRIVGPWLAASPPVSVTADQEAT